MNEKQYFKFMNEMVATTAKILKENGKSFRFTADATVPVNNSAQWCRIVQAFADEFQPKFREFDRMKFLEACGF